MHRGPDVLACGSRRHVEATGPITQNLAVGRARPYEGYRLPRRYDDASFGTLLSRSGPASADWLFLYAGKEYDSGTGLYDFSARLYDPALLRFLGPDPARQFSSPYVFASNNPLNFMDPSGNISVWAQVGIGIAMAALAVAGIALSIVTAGAAHRRGGRGVGHGREAVTAKGQPRRCSGGRGECPEVAGALPWEARRVGGGCGRRSRCRERRGGRRGGCTETTAQVIARTRRRCSGVRSAAPSPGPVPAG